MGEGEEVLTLEVESIIYVSVVALSARLIVSSVVGCLFFQVLPFVLPRHYEYCLRIVMQKDKISSWSQEKFEKQKGSEVENFFMKSRNLTTNCACYSLVSEFLLYQELRLVDVSQ